MEIIITETTSRAIEINLPYYSKNEVRVYKVISEKEMFIINTFDPGIEFCSYNSSGAYKETNTIITEQEFNDKFEEIITLLKLKNYGK